MIETYGNTPEDGQYCQVEGGCLKKSGLPGGIVDPVQRTFTVVLDDAFGHDLRLKRARRSRLRYCLASSRRDSSLLFPLIHHFPVPPSCVHAREKRSLFAVISQTKRRNFVRTTTRCITNCRRRRTVDFYFVGQPQSKMSDTPRVHT